MGKRRRPTPEESHAKAVLLRLVKRVAVEVQAEPAHSLSLVHSAGDEYRWDDNGLGNEIKSVFTSPEYRAAVRLLGRSWNDGPAPGCTPRAEVRP